MACFREFYKNFNDLVMILFIRYVFFMLIALKCFSQNTVQTRFSAPKNFERTALSKNHFGAYLRDLPLKRIGAKVRYFDGNFKSNDVYQAVIDLPIGNKNLHQCADAVMRLRADYLYKLKLFDQIHFNFTNGFRVDFSKWIKGYRIKLNGNKTSWIKTALPSCDQKTYWQYLENIFQYAGTASLEKELKAKKIDSLEVGDVFIKGGFPGHVVIVIDKAINPKTKQVFFMLAQSYMPAQELQVLKNSANNSISPWYELQIDQNIITPEWTFSTNQLKSF